RSNTVDDAQTENSKHRDRQFNQREYEDALLVEAVGEPAADEGANTETQHENRNYDTHRIEIDAIPSKQCTLPCNLIEQSREARCKEQQSDGWAHLDCGSRFLKHFFHIKSWSPGLVASWELADYCKRAMRFFGGPDALAGTIVGRGGGLRSRPRGPFFSPHGIAGSQTLIPRRKRYAATFTAAPTQAELPTFPTARIRSSACAPRSGY